MFVDYNARFALHSSRSYDLLVWFRRDEASLALICLTATGRWTTFDRVIDCCSVFTVVSTESWYCLRLQNSLASQRIICLENSDVICFIAWRIKCKRNQKEILEIFRFPRIEIPFLCQNQKINDRLFVSLLSRWWMNLLSRRDTKKLANPMS